MVFFIYRHEKLTVKEVAAHGITTGTNLYS